MLLKDFRKKISEDINNSNLPIDAIYFVMKDIMNEIIDLYNLAIQNEKKENNIDEEEISSENNE